GGEALLAAVGVAAVAVAVVGVARGDDAGAVAAADHRVRQLRAGVAAGAAVLRHREAGLAAVCELVVAVVEAEVAAPDDARAAAAGDARVRGRAARVAAPAAVLAVRRGIDAHAAAAVGRAVALGAVGGVAAGAAARVGAVHVDAVAP